MATRQASLQSLISIAGASLLALGLVFLFANLDSVAATVSLFAGISEYEVLDLLPALGLVGLHAVQAYEFDQTGFMSAFVQILVSFWPLVLIFAGALVLRRALRHRSVESRQASKQPEANNVRSY